MDRLYKQMRLGIAWTAAQHWGVQVIRLAVLLGLARLVAPHAFGSFALASTIVGLAQLISGQGITAAVVQRSGLEERHKAAAFVAMLAGSVLLAGTTGAAAPPLAHWMSQPSIVPLLRILVWSIPLNALSALPIALWRRDLQFRRIALITTSSQILASALALVLALRGAGIWCLVVRQMSEAILMVLFTVRMIPWRLIPRATWSGYREIVRIAAPIAGVNLMALGRNRLDELVIGTVLGVDALGYYAVSRRQIDGVSAMVPAVIGNAMLPILSRIQKDPQRVQALMRRGLAVLGACTLPTYAGLAAAAGTWVPLLLGERWRPAVPVIQGFAVVAVCRALVGYGLAALLAIGHPGKRFLFEALNSGVSLLLTLIALSRGIAAIAFVTAIGMVALMPIELGWISRWLPLSVAEQMLTLRRPFIGSVLLMAMIGAFRAIPLLRIHPFVLLGFCAASGLLLVFYCYRRLPALNHPSAPVEAAEVVIAL
jgi:O-antigen/teichoic acid export membrane protein